MKDTRVTHPYHILTQNGLGAEEGDVHRAGSAGDYRDEVLQHHHDHQYEVKDIPAPVLIPKEEEAMHDDLGHQLEASMEPFP